MTQPTAYMSGQAFMGMAVETTKGTAIAATFWPPFDSPQLTPNQTYLDDKGMRGSPVDVYDVIMGVRSDTMEWGGDVHADTFPNLLRAVLGGTDAKTGAGPYAHVIGLLNSATTGSQAPSYTLQYFNGFNTQQIAGAQCASLEIDFNAVDAVKYKTKFIGQPFTVITTPTTETYSAVDKVIPAWNNTVSIAAAASALLIEGSLTIERLSTDAIQTADATQGPALVFQGPCKVTGKLTFLVSTSDPFLSASLTYLEQAVVLTFTDPSSTHTVALTMTKVQMKNGKYTTGSVYVRCEVDFEGVANATDAITGYAPIKTTTTNSQSTTY